MLALAWLLVAVPALPPVTTTYVIDARLDPATRTVEADQTIRFTSPADGPIDRVRELDDVLARWTQRTRGHDDGRRTYLWFSMLQPHPDTTVTGGHCWRLGCASPTPRRSQRRSTGSGPVTRCLPTCGC